MDRSQLRKLAQQHAKGELEEEEYQRLRRELIDGIVAGRISIAREPSPLRKGQSTQEEEREAEEESGGRVPFKLAYLVAGVAVLAVIVWLALPGGEQAESPAGDSRGSAPPVSISVPGPGQGLIEDFLGKNDWSEASVGQFKGAWEALSEVEKQEAKSASVFRELSTAIHQEINAQQALADLGDGGGAQQTSRRVYELGKYLGLASSLPKPQASAPPEEEPVAQSAAQSAPEGEELVSSSSEPPTVEELLAEITNASDEPEAAEEPAAEESLEEVAEEDNVRVASFTESSGSPVNNWLESQSVNGYTLQLFAMNDYGNVEKVIASYPELDLHIVSLKDDEPKHRILYGTFETQDLATSKYKGLPAAITEGRSKPVIKSVQELRASAAGAAATSVHNLDLHREWLQVQRGDHYTLQLFAMNADHNVERLVTKYPELNLKVHLSNDHRSRFRILYGAFETSENAREAFAKLPPEIAEQAGQPVVKTFAELQDIVVTAAP